ncbi:MAG: hypothetical protein IJ428_04670 [Clostridia bacterium]|nr:hypothetical protein [Clostridia bacterium]
MRNYREFIRMLSREAGKPTLFEPYPSKNLISQIIWRAGSGLWDSTQNMVSTLISFYDNIGADTAVIPASKDNINDVLSLGSELTDGIKFTILSDDIEALKAADSHDSVCALATKNPLVYGKDHTKPVIFIAGRDVILGIESSIERGLAGVYITENMELLWKRYGDKIALLGGLADSIVTAAPARIYERVRALHEMTGGKAYAIGTGLTGADADYLGFISMLYMYNTLSEN